MTKRWRIFFSLGLALFALLMLTGCADPAAPPPVPENPNRSAGEGPSLESAINARVETLLQTMTLEEKVGQLFMIGFKGSEISKPLQDLLMQKKIGGVILYDRNMSSPAQVARLTNQLQETAKSYTRVPLWISVDQEGGMVTRMKERVTQLPSEQEIGRWGTSGDAQTFARITGEELLAMGIQINFAPVLDLSATDARSYGANPTRAVELAKGALAGYRETGVIPTLKHFPGTGRTQKDPHHDPYTIEAGADTLRQHDLVPFRQLIKRGGPADPIGEDVFIMVTHIQYAAFDPKRPATLSPIIIDQLLRTELGFSGVVVTDDMEMGAMTKLYPFAEMGPLALQAGADLILVCHEAENQKQVYDGVIQAVRSEKLSEKRIDQSLRRILRAKLAHVQRTFVDPLEAEQRVGKSGEEVERFFRLAGQK